MLHRKMIAVDDAVEAFEAVGDGDGTIAFVAVVTGPTAETGDDPGGPGEAVGREGILLLDGAALQSSDQGGQDKDLLRTEDAAGGWCLVDGGAGQHQLH